MKVGFVGLGIMGSRMAANLLASGREVLVYNRSPEKAEALAAQGAAPIKNLAEMAAVDVLFSMLAHPQAVLDTAVGADGFLNHLQPGALWVDCSTVNPSFARQMAAEADARRVQFLEAPVAGTKPHAANGELVFFVGGAAENLERCRPLLDVMGRKVVHVGAHGEATSLKIVVNMMLGMAMASFAEAMALGQGLGLSSETLFDTLIGGAVTAPFVGMKREMMATGDYDPQFPLQWMQKDMQLAAVSAYEAGVGLPIANVTKEMYQRAVQAGLGAQDFSAIYQYLQ